MATTVARLQAVLTAHTAQFEKAMLGAETRMGKTRKMAGVAGLAIAGGLAYGLEKSVKAAEKAEVNQKRLEVAFKTAGLSAKVYEGRIKDLTARGRELGFSGGDQKQALGSLIVATHNYNKAAKEMAVVEDIARFRHVDLTAAAKMLTMAQSGSQRATKQLGLVVAAVTTEQDKAKIAYTKAKDALDRQYPSLSKMTEAQRKSYYEAKNNLELQYKATKAYAVLDDKQATAAKVIDLVRQKLHGQAQAFSETTAGQAERFRAQMTYISATLGKVLLPAVGAVTGKLADLATGLSQHPALVKKAVVALGILSGALITLSVSMKAVAVAGRVLSVQGGVISALVVTVGLLTYAFMHQAAAGKKVDDAYKGVAASARQMKDAELLARQAGLSLEQAHLSQQQAANAVTHAQQDYNAAVKQYGVHSQQARDAALNLKQAQLDLKQSNVNLTQAQQANTDAQKENKKAQDLGTESIIKSAHAQQNFQTIVGSVQSAVHHKLAQVNLGWASNTSEVQKSLEKARLWAEGMRNQAKQLDRTNPKLAAAARAAGDLAIHLGKIPSDTQIRFIVRTIQLAGSGNVGGTAAGQGHYGGVGGRAAGGRIPGPRVAADSVPAMLSPGEFVVTGGGEKMLEQMTFPGVLNWLQGAQPRHFAGGGRVHFMDKLIEYVRLYKPPPGVGGGAVSTTGLVPQVLRALSFARGHGWRGSVTSGFRSHASQQYLWDHASELGLVRGVTVARPGTSSHERGQAVDVSDYTTFGATMSRAPRSSRLYNFIPSDPVHYSVSGHRAGGRVRGYSLGGFIDDHIKRGLKYAWHKVWRGGRGMQVTDPTRDTYIGDVGAYWDASQHRFVLDRDHGRDVGIRTIRMQRDWFNRMTEGEKAFNIYDLIKWWEGSGYAEQLRQRRTMPRLRRAAGGRVGQRRHFAQGGRAGMRETLLRIGRLKRRGGNWQPLVNRMFGQAAFPEEEGSGSIYAPQPPPSIYDPSLPWNPYDPRSYNPDTEGSSRQYPSVGRAPSRRRAVPDAMVINVNLGGDNVGTVVVDLLQRKATTYERANGRPLFGRR